MNRNKTVLIIGSIACLVFVATIILWSTANDQNSAESLLSSLQDEDEGIRTAAARALLAQGRVEAIPVLIAALSEVSVSVTARNALNQYIEYPLDITDQEYDNNPAGAQAQWQLWWDGFGDQLIWDSGITMFTI